MMASMIFLTAGSTTQFVIAEPDTAGMRFHVAGAASVSDTQTGLIWTVKDNRADIDWKKSNGYCNDLVLDEASDWRLPTIDQLKALFDWRAFGPPRSLKLSRSNSWSLTRDDSSSAFYFDFNAGSQVSSTLKSSSDMRVLCVRGSEAEDADTGN
jgi:hypothetical protein